MSNIKISIDQFEDSEWFFGESTKTETAEQEPLWYLLFKYNGFILLNENEYEHGYADPFPKTGCISKLVQMLEDQGWNFYLDDEKRYIVIDTEKTEKRYAVNTETTYKKILGQKGTNKQARTHSQQFVSPYFRIYNKRRNHQNVRI